MLKNNNGAILRKLTIRSLRSGKMRNLFIIITVALAAALISGLAGFAIGMDKKEERELAVSPMSFIPDLTGNRPHSSVKTGGLTRSCPAPGTAQRTPARKPSRCLRMAPGTPATKPCLRMAPLLWR